jgi:hypothetical protein
VEGVEDILVVLVIIQFFQLLHPLVEVMVQVMRVQVLQEMVGQVEEQEIMVLQVVLDPL